MGTQVQSRAGDSSNAAPEVERYDRLGLPQQASADDGALVRAVLRGQTRLFAVLMRRHNARIYRIARAITRDDGEAEDVAQHTFLAAHHALQDFRAHGSFGAWISRIAVRESLRRRKRQQRQREVVTRFEQVAVAPHDRLDPELDQQRRQVRSLLESLVDGLPDSYRPVFMLRDVQELSTQETAAALELSEEAVRVRLHRARALLRARLAERLDVEPSQLFDFAGERCDRIVENVFRQLAPT